MNKVAFICSLLFKKKSMNKFLILALAVLVTGTNLNAQNKQPAKKSTTPAKGSKASGLSMKNLNDSFSYAAGMNIAASMKDQGITSLNTDLVKKAIEDVFANKKLSLTQEQANMTLQEQLQQYAMKKINAERAKGAAFLAANKSKAGIMTLPSGIQYQVIKAGEANGLKPTAMDSVEVNYAGTTLDGVEFDNSYKRGAPVKFKLNEVISGWTEILQQMTKGAHWKVYIPSELGYGERGNGAIPPGATLIFDIEVLGVYPVAK
jgi:FKBP-type peptidyl-prolyl cis-trans isomerase FklB